MFLNFNMHFEALRIGIFEFRFHRLKGGVNENPMGPKNKGSMGAKEPKKRVKTADHPYYLLLWQRPPRDQAIITTYKVVLNDINICHKI